jgi:hypothetical protein
MTVQPLLLRANDNFYSKITLHKLLHRQIVFEVPGFDSQAQSGLPLLLFFSSQLLFQLSHKLSLFCNLSTFVECICYGEIDPCHH